MASIMDLQKLQEILDQLERLTLNRKDDVAGFIKAMKNCSQAEYESLIKFVHRGIGYEAEWCNPRNEFLKKGIDIDDFSQPKIKDRY